MSLLCVCTDCFRRQETVRKAARGFDPSPLSVVLIFSRDSPKRFSGCSFVSLLCVGRSQFIAIVVVTADRNIGQFSVLKFEADRQVC